MPNTEYSKSWRSFRPKERKLNKQGTQLTNLLTLFRITTSSEPIQSTQTYCSVITLHPVEHPEDISSQLLSSSGPQDLIRWVQMLLCKEGFFLSALLRWNFSAVGYTVANRASIGWMWISLIFFVWNIEQSICYALLSLNMVTISRIIHAFWLVLSYGQLEEKRKDDVTANNILLLNLIKQIDSVLLWVCIVIDHRRSQNVVKHRWHTRLRVIGPFCPYHMLTSFLIYYEQTQGNMESIC